jgi:hypothetical protein
MLRHVVVAPVFLLSTGMLSADPLELVEYKSAEGRFVVLIPGEVKVRTDKNGNVPTTTHISNPAPGLMFSVTYFDLPADLAPGQSRTTLKQFAEGIKGKVVTDKEVKVGPQKLPGRETLYQRKDSHMRQLLAIDKRRMYIVIVGSAAKDEVTNKVADRFINGFEVTK